MCATLRRTWQGKSLRGSSNEYLKLQLRTLTQSAIVLPDDLPQVAKDLPNPSADLLLKPTPTWGLLFFLGYITALFSCWVIRWITQSSVHLLCFRPTTAPHITPCAGLFGVEARMGLVRRMEWVTHSVDFVAGRSTVRTRRPLGSVRSRPFLDRTLRGRQCRQSQRTRR